MYRLFEYDISKRAEFKQRFSHSLGVAATNHGQHAAVHFEVEAYEPARVEALLVR
jgi:hypothetical protein